MHENEKYQFLGPFSLSSFSIFPSLQSLPSPGTFFSFSLFPYFLAVLEDLAYQMKKPCIVDLKIGTQGYGDDATTAKKMQQVCVIPSLLSPFLSTIPLPPSPSLSLPLPPRSQFVQPQQVENWGFGCVE